MSNKRIDDDVLEVLSQAECKDEQLFLRGQLDRTLYVKTNKVLTALGGKWNRKAKAHVFPEPASALIADVVAVGAYVDAKKLFQAFNTPQELAEQLCDCLQIDEHTHALEPSAGTGVIARELRRRGASVECVEIQEKLVDGLRSDGFLVHCGDFLEVRADNSDVLSPIAVIAMNPPFTRGQDMQHVRKAFDILAPRGQLAAITAPGWKFRGDRQAVEFRQWLDGLDHDATDIPEGAFKESGTSIRTVMLTIEKPE